MSDAVGAQIVEPNGPGESYTTREEPVLGLRASWKEVSFPGAPVRYGNSVVDNPLKLIKYPACALSEAQRACCDELARRVQVHVEGDTRQTRVSRRIIHLHSDPECIKLLGQLVGSLQGLPKRSRLVLDHADQSVEPTILVSRFLPEYRSMGTCSAHQDDLPCGRPSRPAKSVKRLVFFLLMGDVGVNEGPTFVFPNSHYLKKAPRAPPGGHAPLKSPYQVSARNLMRDLTEKCGEPILLTGEKYALFRMPASLWHGALANHVERDRVVVGFAYCYPSAVGTNLVTSSGRMGR